MARTKIIIQPSRIARAYIEHYQKGDPIQVNRKTPTGMFILSLVEPVRCPKPSKTDPNPNQVVITITERIAYPRGVDSRRTALEIPSQNIRLLNSFLERLFKKELFLFLQGRIEANKRIEDGIVLFREKFGLGEEDVTLESLKKSFWRWRKEHNSREIRLL